jgi:hypothetical protein
VGDDEAAVGVGSSPHATADDRKAPSGFVAAASFMRHQKTRANQRPVGNSTRLASRNECRVDDMVSFAANAARVCRVPSQLAARRRQSEPYLRSR